MAIVNDVFFATITELNKALRAKEFSATELTRAYLDRLEKSGPRYNALALILREQAIRQARAVEDDMKRERFRGPLQGVPYGAKDLLSVQGQITTWGAKPYAAQVFDYDATVVHKLARAGSILTGKLSMVELAGGGGYRYPSASLFGPGLNPWDISRWSGGSSSGSGSAVAAGLVPFAIGSETSGSILTPAAYCGVTGLRPTYGLVSRYGAMALSWTMDKIGPMCRSAEDCGLVLQVIAGKDDNDPASAGKSFYYAPQFTRELKTIRVGWNPRDFEEFADPATRPAFREALQVIRSFGVEMQEVSLGSLPYGAVTGTVISAEGSAAFEGLIESGRVDELADKKQIAGLRAGLDIGARDYLKAMRVRRLVQQEFRRILTNIDVLLAPSRYNVASRISEPLDRPAGTAAAKPSEATPPPTTPSASEPRPQPTAAGLRSLIPAGNLAGLPALSVPCGLAEGLPVALQFVSRPFTENLILTLGGEFQKRTDWHRRRPKV
ncbi:MAG TPA: amidase [Bryobacteraceae bacterium]|nr:amidase [Bryobacteraceae bacterium]